MRTNLKKIDRKVKQALPLFLSFCLTLIIMIFVTRIFELVYITNAFRFPSGSWEYELKGFLYDLLFGIKICAWLMIPFFLIFQFSRIISFLLFWIVSGIIIIGSVTLSFYFGTAKVPLGADLFGYSSQEITSTIDASGGLNFISIISIALTTFLTVFLFRKLRIFRIHRLKQYALLILLFPFLFFGEWGDANPSKFKNEFNAFVASNKTGFFISSNLNYFFPDDNSDKIEVVDDNIDTTTKKQKNPPVILDINYPLMHRDVSEDVLGSFFNKDTVLPNFVFIISESLGRAYSGDGAYLGSFTPYLDELMKKGLYWSNMLSTSGRTFNVLPSLLGSLPFGEHGFCEMGDKMPYQQSIISILLKNGYQSSFYYGGHADFDNMSQFMKKQGVTRIVDEKNFEPSYKRIPPVKGFSWGYGDKETFKKYLTDINQLPSSPRIDVILTLSMHDPFTVDSQWTYNKMFVDRLASLKISPEQKEFDKQYHSQFSTILYYDNALKMLISEYSKRPDFKNTIFIITGDHRMPEIPISSQIDRFHVPLVIWSPMLKSSGTFNSISSHFDVVPSLMAYLKAQYKIKVPSVVSWVGTGLDMEPSFRNNHSYPMMRNKTEFMDYLDHEYFLAGKTLYIISPNMYIDPVDNQKQLNITKNKFNMFSKMNLQICTGNKILPDSVQIR